METHSRPYVTISAAATMDGRIAGRGGDSEISSQEDLVRLHRLRARTDAILIGKNTMLRDDPLLTVRRAPGKSPVRVVLDPAGQTPSNSRMLATCSSVPTILVLTGRAKPSDRRRLEGFGAKIIHSEEDPISPRWLAGRLYQSGIKSLLVEGGGATNWHFIRDGIFDEIILTLAPRLAGGGVSLVEGEGFARISEGPALRLKSARRQGDEVVLRYTRV